MRGLKLALKLTPFTKEGQYGRIINDDGTASYFDDATESQDNKEMYLPAAEEN